MFYRNGADGNIGLESEERNKGTLTIDTTCVLTIPLPAEYSSAKWSKGKTEMYDIPYV